MSSPFQGLRKGDVIRAGGRRYTVSCVDLDAGVVELEGKSLTTLMEHGKQPGSYVITSARSQRIVESFEKAP